MGKLSRRFRWAKPGSDIEEAKDTGGKRMPRSLAFLGPPNLQLNISSESSSSQRKGAELFTAACIALILQFSLLVIAAITVQHKPTKEQLGYEPPPFGLACYIGGSLLLFIGMAICSFVIESSTVEFVWERRKDETENLAVGDVNAYVAGNLNGLWQRLFGFLFNSRNRITSQHASSKTAIKRLPRIVWLQKAQRVSDQTFGSYAILGGEKRYVLTSSRLEDVRKDQTGGTDDPVRFNTRQLFTYSLWLIAK